MHLDNSDKQTTTGPLPARQEKSHYKTTAVATATINASTTTTKPSATAAETIGPTTTTPLQLQPSVFTWI